MFVDGRFRADLSDPPPGIGVGSFAAQPEFGTLAQPGRDPLVALNTMLAEDGARLDVPAGADAGVVLIASLATEAMDRITAFHPRHSIRLGAGARLTLIETAGGEGALSAQPGDRDPARRGRRAHACAAAGRGGGRRSIWPRSMPISPSAVL